MKGTTAGFLGALVLAGCAAAPPTTAAPSHSWAEILLQSLGSPDVDERVRATEELAKKLPDVEELLRANLQNPDAEVAARCRELLARLEKPPRIVVAIKDGKVALVDPKTARVAIDLRSRDGVKAGQKVVVTRQAKRVGELEIVDVQAWGSWAKAVGETRLDSILKGDFAAAEIER